MPNFITSAPQTQMNVDYAAQQNEIQRKMQLADMLRQQAMAPANRTEVVGGHAIKESPINGLSKILQGFMSGKMQSDANEKNIALSKALAEKQSGELDSMLGIDRGPAKAESAPYSPMMEGDQSGNINAPQPNQLQEQKSPLALPSQVPQVSKADDRMSDLRSKAKAAYLMGNKDLFNKLVENMTTMTDAERNDRYMGITAPQSKIAELAKRNKEGTMSLLPGQTNIMPNGERVVAPNYDTGIAGGIGPNGQPTMSPIQGGGVLAQMAGDKKRAEAAGSAGFDMITVDTPNGPILMTKEQAAKMSGGGQQNSPIDFTASNGVKLNFTNTTPQQVFDQAMKSGNPDAMQAVTEWAQSGKKAPGIPLQTEAQKAKLVDTAKADVAIEKSRIEAAQSPEAQQKVIDAKSVVDLLDMAEPHYKAATGSTLGALRDSAGNVFGQSSKSSEAAAQLAVIGGALVAKQPKMSGPQSDKDVLLYREMAGKIGDPTVPMGQKVAAAKTIRMINSRYADQNKESIATQAVDKNRAGVQMSTEDMLKHYLGK